MPARQGVMHWPAGEGGLVALADEAELPFLDLSIDRLLLVHAVECSEQLRSMLREAWRVLSGIGRLLVVVTNRRGLWARLASSTLCNGYHIGRQLVNDKGCQSVYITGGAEELTK